MHSVYSADLAGLISHYGPAIIQRKMEVPADALTEYWTASRSRLELWHQVLSRYRRFEQIGHSDRLKRWWKEHSIVLEEVLVTEMLTRVVAGLACGLEEEKEAQEFSPVAHAVQSSHLEVRNRVQQVMLFGRGNSVHDVVRLNRLRQGIERWTDAMLGRMATDCPVMLRFAIDHSRASEYAEEMRSYGEGAARNTAAYLMNCAMHDLIRRRTSADTAFATANHMVVQSVMKLLRPELYDDTGVLKSLWMHRFEMGPPRSDQFMEPADSFADTESNHTVQENTAQCERWYI